MIVRVLGVKKSVRDLKGYQKRKVSKAGIIMEAYAKKIRDDARKKAPVDLGFLRQGIHAFTKKRPSRIDSEIISQAPWSSVSEFGSRPHAAPYMYIKEWAERHGLDPFAVWWHIKEHGTKEHPFMRPAYMKNRKRLVKAIKRVFNDAR